MDLAQLLRTCTDLRRQQLDARHLDCQLTAGATLKVQGDAFLLQQAILNLLDNAIEFSPDGGRIELTLEAADDHATISVRDHGSGAPDYALGQLFERFYSLPRPATGRKSTGRKSTGLGLALVREVARLHGGEAEFENHPAGGGLARIRLPLV